MTGSNPLVFGLGPKINNVSETCHVAYQIEEVPNV